MHYKCPACGRLTRFERHERTFGERLRTWASTLRPHSCNECGKKILIDVHYREPKDVRFAVMVVLVIGLLLSVFATFLQAMAS